MTIALNKIAAMLRPDGLFYLWDVMWSFDANETLTQLPAWISAMAKPAGEGFTKEMFETHVREEFSTFSWILEGMIERAGMVLVESNFPVPWYGEFVATLPDHRGNVARAAGAVFDQHAEALDRLGQQSLADAEPPTHDESVAVGERMERSAPW